jgi:hypothetical protein
MLRLECANLLFFIGPLRGQVVAFIVLGSVLANWMHASRASLGRRRRCFRQAVPVAECLPE